MAYPTAGPMDPMPDVMSQGFTAPSPMPAGMFGGGGSNLQNALMAAAAGFMARTRPGLANSMMDQLTQKQVMNRQAQLAMLRDNLEFQRQTALAQQAARLKLMYPDGDFAQSLYQAGYRPGTPEWTHAMQTRTQNELDPAVLTPQGMMLRSQITGAMNAKPLSDADIDAMSNGGQTPQASGGFPHGPYPNIGPYPRY